MARYLLFAFSDCKDPAREDEYNDWYDNMHIPDMLEVPGMISATRWEGVHTGEGQHRKYLALYELETDSLADFDAGVRERGMRTVNEGRFSDLPEFDPPNIPRVYKQIMHQKDAPKSQRSRQDDSR